jgi:CRISPR type III-A-associated protein Csm2
MYQGRNYNKARQSESQLPQNYLSKGYFDTNGNLFEELITTSAEDIAQALGNSSPAMTKHQIRRFYNHVKFLEKKLDLTNDYQTINADLKMLISYASNAACKRPQSIPKLFEAFIRENLDKVKDVKTFHGFIDHFQSVVGFCECYLRK